jgi:hypothetical protein
LTLLGLLEVSFRAQKVGNRYLRLKHKGFRSKIKNQKFVDNTKMTHFCIKSIFEDQILILLLGLDPIFTDFFFLKNGLKRVIFHHKIIKFDYLSVYPPLFSQQIPFQQFYQILSVFDQKVA